MTLARRADDSGVVGANGAMDYEWGETCNGWTVEQRYRLKMRYAESQDVDVTSNFVTWESKDGLRYRFNQTADPQRRTSTRRFAARRGSTARARAASPSSKSPAANHEIAARRAVPERPHDLADRQGQGRRRISSSRQVFDGATDRKRGAGLGGDRRQGRPPTRCSVKLSPLLERPGWHMRLAFFPVDAKAEKPDYELGMVLLDNGVSRDMVIDYGDYTIQAKLDNIEALGKPSC